MSGIKQREDSKGSLKAIQVLINDYPEIMNKHIQAISSHIQQISWVSPLREECMAEYRDAEFINRLNIQEKLSLPLNEFWPKGGPQWDALGIANNDIVLLVEAKANIPELKSPGTQAGKQSITLIKASLEEVKDYIKSSRDKAWTNTYYQYANRLAHLYYLRIKNNIPTYLINVYVIGDKSVNGPDDKETWLSAINQMKDHLGIVNHHPLSSYILDLFIEVSEIQ